MVLLFMVWIVLIDVIPLLQYYFILYPWIHIAIFMTLLQLLQFVFCGYIVAVTIVETIRDWIRSRSGVIQRNIMAISKLPTLSIKEVVDYIMRDEKLRLLFKQQAKREWSVENYQVYLEIREFQKLSLHTRNARLKQRRLADKIYVEYVKSDAIMEVNLSNRVREGCRAAILKSYGKPLDSKFFDDVLDEVKVNLGDTVSRFFFSKEYIKYYEGQELKETIMENL